MKKGEYLVCSDKEELKECLRQLGEAGYGAVTWDYDNNIIRITRVPVYQKRGTMKNPCETCLHAITCEAHDKHCKRKEAYDNWKEKAKEIRKHT